jgi:hypothetical protein
MVVDIDLNVANSLTLDGQGNVTESISRPLPLPLERLLSPQRTSKATTMANSRTPPESSWR